MTGVCFQWKKELEDIVQLATEDSDQWVAMVGGILRTYPSTGSLNSDIEATHGFFHVALADLKKLGM